MNIPLVDLARQHQQIEDEVSAGIDRVMKSGAFILGPEVETFESDFARFCSVEHSIGVGSGTDALELAVRALGIGPGDEVIVPANSFIASALAVLRAGAGVRLVDCDLDTFLIDPVRIEEALGPRVKALMPVHLFGQLAPTESLEGFGLPIIEDAAQAQGAERYGRRAGSLGVIAATSFYPGKNIGAYGDAGAVLTSDDDLASSVRKLRNWGSEEKYHHPEAGFNSRLDTIQAVVLSAKLTRLAEWNQQRAIAAERYAGLLAEDERVNLPTVLDGNTHVWHIYAPRVPNRDEVLAHMRSNGVQAGVHYPIPMHLQGALSELGHIAGDFPAAETAAAEMLSLPMFPGITEGEQEYVVGQLVDALEATGP